MQCFLRIYYYRKCLLVFVYLQNIFRMTAGVACELPDGARGECVPLPACAQYVALLKESTTTELGLKLTRDRRCGIKGNNIKVCCPTVTEDLDPEISPDSDDSDYVDELPAPSLCGREEIRSAPAVWNGKPVESHRMTKWVALLAYRRSPSTWECGGSIITKRHVLTAAHCIRESLYVVRIGELDLAKTKKKFEPMDFYIKKKIRHEQYTKYHNDIAILVLDGTIPFDDPYYYQYIAPICLPEADFPYEKFGPLNIFITGWGETEKNGERPTNLLYAYLRILDQDLCKSVYSDEALTIDKRVFCAGDPINERDACNGDSGGPIVGIYSVEGYRWVTFYYQLGLISYGYRCSAQRFSGVYTNITHFMPWILETVTGKSRPRLWIKTTEAPPLDHN